MIKCHVLIVMPGSQTLVLASWIRLVNSIISLIVIEKNQNYSNVRKLMCLQMQLFFPCCPTIVVGASNYRALSVKETFTLRLETSNT